VVISPVTVSTLKNLKPCKFVQMECKCEIVCNVILMLVVPEPTLVREEMSSINQ